MSEDKARATYNAVAARYAEEFAADLAQNPLDRALLRTLAELAAPGPAPLADLGCGPGYEARFLASLGYAVTGLDLSPGMLREARQRHAGMPGLSFVEGSLLSLPFADGALAGACAIYSIIHLDPSERPQAYREMARVIRPGGALLLSVHTSAEGFAPGSCRHMQEWWGHAVSLDGHFIDDAEVSAGLAAVGFSPVARLTRGPVSPREFPSQRCYLLLRR